jgi:hypothetical protein
MTRRGKTAGPPCRTAHRHARLWVIEGKQISEEVQGCAENTFDVTTNPNKIHLDEALPKQMFLHHDPVAFDLPR